MSENYNFDPQTGEPINRNAQAGQAHGGDPVVNFAYSLNGKKFTECGEAFKMKQGKWIGAKFGFVSVETDAKADRGWIDVDWIRVTKNEM